ncbi:MAG: IS1 family transposase [Nitrospinota bacterium]|nr:IS1 family transposase [Nitrospinota bacterium]
MNRLSVKKRAQILSCLVEGNSIRSTVRITGAAKNTIVKLLADVGSACSIYQSEHLVNLPCKNIQVDEIWSFCYAKSKNVPADKKGQFGYGDVWTWTALCADSKLVPCWHVGSRNGYDAKIFIDDLATRMANRIQLTSDGHKVYLEAVEGAFGNNVDYAMLVKIYGKSAESEKRYSPADCVGIEKSTITGDPDKKKISTSFVERQNLTMRMGMRRFTRLTNGFSKKVENHEHSIALHFMHYNFVRIHKSLRVTPAMEAGITDRLWTIEDIVELTEK